MYFLTLWTLSTLFFSLLFLLLRTAAPLPLVGLFFCLVVLAAVSSFFLVCDFMPYMLYLIYVGGLLVLVVYMVIISTNYQVTKAMSGLSSVMSIVGIFCMVVMYTSNFPSDLFLVKNLSSMGDLELRMGALVSLVAFLLYMFLFICESVRVGGRSLKVSILSY